jgi:hypothetical protein
MKKMKLKKFVAIILMIASLTMVAGCKVSTSSKGEQSDTSSGKDSLDFDIKNYTSETITMDGKMIKCRSYQNIVYVKNPIDTKYQSMNIYIPEEYFNKEFVGVYTVDTAPIFFPNTVGGYMPGEAGTITDGSSFTTTEFVGGVAAGRGAPDGGAKAAATALSKGYIVAMPGARGRTTQDENGKYNGKAPAAIVDLKAAVRYLRYNDKAMPGDAEKIISNGTSAGGALSALLGTSGNNADYEPYLNEIGAADTRDDIFASSDYCPITNLENADMAYEWQFNGINDYNNPMAGGAGTLTENQIKLSNELKNNFPTYVNSLELKKSDGTLLSLDAEGNGNFKDYIKSYIIASAQKALDSGTDLSGLNWLKMSGKTVIEIDYEKYNQYIKRMKSTPAFDDVGLTSGENDEFGTDTNKPQHFTKFSQDNSTASDATMADSSIIKMMNAMNYIGADNTTTAKYFRIRWGSIDANTSEAIPLILATKLQNSGYNADFAMPWNTGHGGDYDLNELFDWTDKICQGK